MSLPAETSTPLVSTEWLAAHLGEHELVVLDATAELAQTPTGGGYVSGFQDYLEKGHIPGARFADLLERLIDPDSSVPLTRPGATRFAEEIAKLGVSNDSTVIVYDTNIGAWAARLWWLFRAFGHQRVHVLDGGYRKWLSEHRPVQTGPIEIDPSHFEAVENGAYWALKEDVQQVVRGEDAAILISAVPPFPKNLPPELSPPKRYTGRIPGSLSVPYTRVIDRSTNTVHGSDIIAETFPADIGRSRTILYCGSGIGASLDALALASAGRDNIAIYDGSLFEWAADEEAPLEYDESA